MKRSAAAGFAALLMAVLPNPVAAMAASDSQTTSVAVDPANQIQMQVSADCVAGQNRCFFNTSSLPAAKVGEPPHERARRPPRLLGERMSNWQTPEPR